MTEHKRGTGRIVWGIVLMVLVAPLVGGLLMWLGVSRAIDASEDIHRVSPGQAVRLEGGKRVAVVADEAQLPPERRTATCTVRSDDGSAPFTPNRIPGGAGNGTSGGEYEVGSFTPSSTGDYTISCPPHDVVRLDNSNAAARAAGWGVGGTLGGLLLGGLVFLTGLVLFIVGLVKRSARPPVQAPPGWVSYQ